jgi:hypothetical protein
MTIFDENGQELIVDDSSRETVPAAIGERSWRIRCGRLAPLAGETIARNRSERRDSGNGASLAWRPASAPFVSFITSALRRTVYRSGVSNRGSAPVGCGRSCRMENVMAPFVVFIYLCAASTAPADCDRTNAIDVALGPPAANELMCGLGAQQMMAQTAIRPKDGEYFKIACVRRKAVPEIDEAQGKSALDPISR